jgi:hypothetical protein
MSIPICAFAFHGCLRRLEFFSQRFTDFVVDFSRPLAFLPSMNYEALSNCTASFKYWKDKALNLLTRRDYIQQLVSCAVAPVN